MTHRIVKTLFVDVGGVLLTNGWDDDARASAASIFDLNLAELHERHWLNYSTIEEGKLTLNDYLDRVVFHRPRPFSKTAFRDFILQQSQPFSKMIDLIVKLKHRYGLKIVVVSNEMRELNDHRIHAFKLNRFVDLFISSCYVHVRKPDVEIFKLALDISQTPAENVIFIENTPLFVEVAESLGIRSVLHIDYESTCTQLSLWGLDMEGCPSPASAVAGICN